MIIPVSVNPNETCQCPFSIRCQIFLISVVGGCWSLVRQPVLTHHSENKPTRHRKKQIPELHSTELSCLRQPCQRSASAPAAHPYEAAQATSLRMCSPPLLLYVRCRRMCKTAAPGLLLLWAPGWSQPHLCVCACVTAQHKTHYANYNGSIYSHQGACIWKDRGV